MQTQTITERDSLFTSQQIACERPIKKIGELPNGPIACAVYVWYDENNLPHHYLKLNGTYHTRCKPEKEHNEWIIVNILDYEKFNPDQEVEVIYEKIP